VPAIFNPLNHSGADRPIRRAGPASSRYRLAPNPLAAPTLRIKRRNSLHFQTGEAKKIHAVSKVVQLAICSRATVQNTVEFAAAAGTM